MARIRTIKPDFWDSKDTVAADLRTRLLYIAMWNWADDYGIGDGTPVRIIGFAFPEDDIPASDYPRLLADVSGAFNVVFFEFSGRRYYVIPAWEEHQRTEKRAKAKVGLLEAAQEAIIAAQARKSESPQNVAESPTHTSGSADAGSRKSEVGKGTEEPPYPPDDEPAPIAYLPARSNNGGLSPKQLAVELNKTERSITAYKIAEAFSASSPIPIQRNLLAGIGTQIDACLRDGIPPPAIANGLKAWTDSDSFSPTQIPNYVHKANNGSRNRGIGKPTEKALGYDAALTELLQEVETL